MHMIFCYLDIQNHPNHIQFGSRQCKHTINMRIVKLNHACVIDVLVRHALLSTVLNQTAPRPKRRVATLISPFPNQQWRNPNPRILSTEFSATVPTSIMDFDDHLTELSASSPCIPSGEDFHFYYNFTEFRRPIQEIARTTQSMLHTIGSADNIWGPGAAFPDEIDDAYEWLVKANDDVLELVEELVDELRRVAKEEGEECENGFWSGDEKMIGPKPKVSFHIPTITKPQYAYNIVVDNSKQPFEHVLLEKTQSDDGQRFIHPLEKLSVLDFVDRENVENLVPEKPPSIECTPFKLVEEVKGLKEVAAKLSSVNEFAVDLEHNQYRSFQGLTCLMQISTRTEDFVIDTLKLHAHVGPYLREVFKDPTKKKVMHGANRDIIWLQRDFGIYVCNMFDTGQASRVLKLERFSLQYLLQHFCGVTANKEYQNADWRQRPLPDVMLRYGQEDTHYLLYIYDLMRIKLCMLSKETEGSDDLLLEVYKRSYDVCMQLYEKELLTEDSYLRIYGLRGAGFNGQQLAVVSGLSEWRDNIARADDESPGYVLPNKMILEIARQMPVITSNLRRLVGRAKLPYVERSLDIIVNIVRHSMQNAVSFEEVALRLKEEHAARLLNVPPDKDGTEAAMTQTPKDGCAAEGSIEIENAPFVDILDNVLFSSDPEEEPFQDEDKDGQVKVKSNFRSSGLASVCVTTPKKNRDDKSKLVVEIPSKTSDQQKPVSGSVSTATPVGTVLVGSDPNLDDTVQNKLEGST
ncbi:hypothetical protein RJT34_21661 [Clitoria ternatea]|uniref:HRDC domain-containing protein n=1 Tax=Clitoria ternatea TaxID=43366 RepID=A0AAN9IUH0_CLITE